MNTIRTIAKLLIISSLTSLGCASTQVARSSVATLRGHIVVDGPSTRAVVVGPAEIHGYSAFAGGEIYTAPAVSGSDHDCGTARTGVTTLQADRVHAIRIEAGQVACLATVKRGGFEFLWHARQPKTESTTDSTTEPMSIAAVDHRR